MGRILLDRVCDILQRSHGILVVRMEEGAFFDAEGIGTWRVELRETDKEFQVEVFDSYESNESTALRRLYRDTDYYASLSSKERAEALDKLAESSSWVAWSFDAETWSALDLAHRVLVILADKALHFPEPTEGGEDGADH